MTRVKWGTKEFDEFAERKTIVFDIKSNSDEYKNYEMFLLDILCMIHDFLPETLNYEEVRAIFNKEMMEGLIEKLYDECVLGSCSLNWLEISIRSILIEVQRRWDRESEKMIDIDYSGDKKKDKREFFEFVDNLRIIKSSVIRMERKLMEWKDKND